MTPQAFPVNRTKAPLGSAYADSVVIDDGMTLRDYFAAKAMAICPLRLPSDSARWCYQYADAMLEARK